MSPFRSRLLCKAFLSVALGLVLWFPIFYWLTVPLINQLAYEVEEKAARTVLDNLTQIVRQSHHDLQAWRQTALDAHRRELKNIVQVVVSWADEMEAEVAAGKLPRAKARQQLLDRLRHVRYGNHDYLWAADYHSVFVSHPDLAFHGRDVSAVRDSQGQVIIPPMVEEARKAGDGYFPYRWQRLDTGKEAEKLSYVRDLPAWGLVIGTGVYIDDVDQEVARRKEVMVADLRRHLHNVKLAGSGYVFIIDGDMNAVVHPDAQLEGTQVAKRINPATGNPIGPELMAAARRPDRTLFYQWNQPGGPDDVYYKKVAWVRHVPEYNWYLAATAYVDDLGRTGHYLSQRLLIAFVLGLIITAFIALAFIRTVTDPILRLAGIARRAVAGDLSAECDIRRDDEIGTLAAAFNNMIARLREHIWSLEERVAMRTQELSTLTEQLETRVAERTSEAKASEAKFRSLLEQSLAGIYVIQDGVFRYVNARFAEIHGFADPAQIVDRALADHLIAPADLDHVTRMHRQVVEGGISRCDIAYAVLRADGSVIDVEASAGRTEFEGKPALIGVALDITERRKIQKALEEQQEKLEAMVNTRTSQLETANQQLQAFTYAASHDLKAPLRGIQSFAFLLEKNYRDSLAGDGVFFLNHIQRSATRMGELIEDLLAHARMEQQDLDIQPVDLMAAMRGALGERHEEIRQRRAEIRMNVPSLMILADLQGLAQALRNILENALKYSGQADHPIIEIGCEEQESTCCLSIRDNGIGFDMAYHDSIFTIFRRLHTYDEYPGSGVGLALVKTAMERMGGEVWATSAPGEGTTFYLRFQRAGAQLSKCKQAELLLEEI